MTLSAQPEVETDSTISANTLTVDNILASVGEFLSWLDQHEETSYDFQAFYASDLCQKIKGLSPLYLQRGSPLSEV